MAGVPEDGVIGRERLVLRPDKQLVFIRKVTHAESPMRQLGVCAGFSANPKLTHGAEMPTNHPVEALRNFSDIKRWFLSAVTGDRATYVFPGDGPPSDSESQEQIHQEEQQRRTS